MPLAELREADAPPAIAAIYDRLRTASGVPLVNLIHRHLATLNGVLPWLWHAIRPPLEDGSLAGARARLAAAIPLPALDPRPADPTILDLVETYNRGNLTNLILLTALRRALAQDPPHPGPPPPRLAPEPMLPTPPPLPRLDALPPSTAALVTGLAARHGAGVVPSLYLHLAHWPDFLAALPTRAAALLDPAAIQAARATTLRFAEAEADAIRPLLAIEGTLPDPRALAPIETFTRQVIPDMVPIGLGLRRLLASGASPG
ncbi:hypothetical protein [Belnapia sp. F-4-1]|uniref:hypothetical protein n=1 Tax=Belnapia sp. F-4-1 TaxID=1545443 RepID=UPI0005B9DECE|nr:hypothetical protein [Belnapia sp. F-4-1]